MCSILGVSYAPNSKIDRRKLANALLRAGEVRGRDASGYAWATKTERGYYKKDLPGGLLTTSKIPQDATSVILHTRAATHGHQRDNRNNHPVESPQGELLLVHNGVIYNHDEVRAVLPEDVAKSLPEVDTSVIPAVIETFGIGATDLLAGDAAVAWLDVQTDDVIHLARFSHSPLSYAFLEDGSFVFASTEAILARALQQMGLRWFGAYPDNFPSLEQGDYIQVVDGQVINQAEVEWNDDYYTQYSSYGWRSVTSGATTVRNSQWWDDDDDLPTAGGKPAVLASTPATTDRDIEPLFWVTMAGDGGARQEFTSIANLAACLRWHAGMTAAPYDLVDDPEAPKELYWVNHIEDIGEIMLDTGEYVSWISKPNEMHDYGSAVPSYIKDGVDLLRKYEVRT